MQEKSSQVCLVHTTRHDGEWKSTRNGRFHDGIGGFIRVQPHHDRGASVPQQSVRAWTRGVKNMRTNSEHSESM